MDITLNDEEKFMLIKAVRNYPLIYDSKRKEHKDSAARNHVWDKISEELNKPSSELKKIWESLRNCYRRCRREEIRNRPRKYSKKVKWRFYEALEFLDEFMLLPEFDDKHDGQNSDDQYAPLDEMNFEMVEFQVRGGLDSETEPNENVAGNAEVASPASSQLSIRQDITYHTVEDLNDSEDPSAKSPRSLKRAGTYDTTPTYSARRESARSVTSTVEDCNRDPDSTFSVFVRDSLREIGDPETKDFVKFKIHELLLKAKRRKLNINL